MGSWTLEVRSTYLATVDEVWAHKTDIAALAAELRPLRLTVDDPERLQAALRGAAPDRFDGRLTGPLGLLGLPWPMEIRASDPPRRYQDASRNALYREFVHEHRVEPSGAGRVRYVDRVRFTPALRPSAAAAWLTRALFLRRHAITATHLRLDEVEGTRARLSRARDAVAPHGAVASA